MSFFMKAQRETVLLILLNLGFAVATVLLFVPRFPFLPVFSSTLFIVLATQALKKTPLAVMLASFTTLLGLFCFGQGGENSAVAVPVLVLTLWGGVFLNHLHHERLKGIS